MISSDAKLVAIYDSLEAKIKALQLKHGVDGARGADGISIKGDQGDRGRDGVGHDGKQGPRGSKGDKGDDGADGISVTSAEVDFDDHLVLKLSDGSEINAGEVSSGSGGGGDKYYRSGSQVHIGPRMYFGIQNIVSNEDNLVVHNLDLKTRNSFTYNVMIQNIQTVFTVTSVDKNSFTIYSLVGYDDAHITVIGN